MSNVDKLFEKSLKIFDHIKKHHPEIDVKKGEKLKPGSLKGGENEPFSGGFEGCVKHFMSQGKSEEQAKGLCGAINRAKYGAKGKH